MRWLAYHISRLLCKGLLAPFTQTIARHTERTALPGPWILAPNHISHFDPPVIGTAMRRKVDWMAMAELFENPVSAAWLRAIDTFPVDRSKVDRRAVRTALARLERGHVVGIFPEGGIRNGESSVLKNASIRPGVGAIAQMSGTPVIPCVILGSDRLYAPANWVPLKRPRIYVAFGNPLTCEGTGKIAREQLEEQLSQSLRDLYQELHRTFSLSDEDFPQEAQRRKGRAP